MGKPKLLCPRFVLHLRLIFAKLFVVLFDGPNTIYGLLLVALHLRLHKLRHQIFVAKVIFVLGSHVLGTMNDLLLLMIPVAYLVVRLLP